MKTFTRFIAETYSPNNVALLRYFLDNDADPYPVWWEICQILRGRKSLARISRLMGQPITSADDLHEMDAGTVWAKLPPAVQKNVMERAITQAMEHNAADAPTKAHMDLRRSTLLPRTTWLVHFSDHADSIATQGFTFGMDDMDRLGLTTWYRDGAKKFGGYNFAFLAESHHAQEAVMSRKYGHDAIIFQSAGVLVDHHGDEETQVIFYGKEVDPRTLIMVRGEDSRHWSVISRQTDRALFAGTYPAVVNWIQTNHQQYRRHLYGQ